MSGGGFLGWLKDVTISEKIRKFKGIKFVESLQVSLD